MAHPKKLSLSETLLEMLPGSRITKAVRTDWHSATFSGQRFCITCALDGGNAAERVRALQAMLPEHEFDLRRFVVADILVTEISEHADHVSFGVEALLLDD